MVADLVFIVYSPDDDIGINILHIYRNESDAIKCVDEHNASATPFDRWSYYSEPLL